MRGTYSHGKTLAVLLKTVKTRKFSPANLSPFTVLYEKNREIIRKKKSMVIVQMACIKFGDHYKIHQIKMTSKYSGYTVCC